MCLELLKNLLLLYCLGDGRNDSPGHSAQYCSYTLMDCHSGSIVSTVVVDKREVNLKSLNMEKLGLQRSLTLLAGTVNVTELVTDAHTQIAAFLRKICHVLRVKRENNYFTFSWSMCCIQP